MKKLILLFILVCLSLTKAYAGIDESTNNATAPIAKWIRLFNISLFGARCPIVVLWLVIGVISLTYHLPFINIKGSKHLIALVRDDCFDP